MITTPVACVVDASVGIKLVITEAHSSEAHALFAHLADPSARISAPDLFYIECANTLRKHIVRFSYPLADAQLNLATLTTLAIQRVALTDVSTDALTIAAQFRISAYDACYVAASDRAGAPLITADAKLVAAMAGSPHNVLNLANLSIPAVPP